MPVKPTPQTWTLRLKNKRTTIVLHVDRTLSLSVLKADLLLALQTAHPDNKLNSQTIPKDASSIRLAKPLDPSNLSTGGWESIEDVVDSSMLDESGGKKKTSSGKSKQSPLSVGLRDGGAVAFRFADGDEEPGEENWDVEVSTYEDVYGLEAMAAQNEAEEAERARVGGLLTPAEEEDETLG
ncbi:hypothetical protein MBLNU457_3123t1 [Dothideomycetes sp. NU457]